MNGIQYYSLARLESGISLQIMVISGYAFSSSSASSIQPDLAIFPFIRTWTKSIPHLRPQGIDKWPGWGVKVFKTIFDKQQSFLFKNGSEKVL